MSTFTHTFGRGVGKVFFHLPDVNQPIKWTDLSENDRRNIEAGLHHPAGDWTHGDEKHITILGVPGSRIVPIFDMSPEDTHFKLAEPMARGLLKKLTAGGPDEGTSLLHQLLEALEAGDPRKSASKSSRGKSESGKSLSTIAKELVDVFGRDATCLICDDPDCPLNVAIEKEKLRRGLKKTTTLDPADLAEIEVMVGRIVQDNAKAQEKNIRAMLHVGIGIAFLAALFLIVLSPILVPLGACFGYIQIVPMQTREVFEPKRVFWW